MTTPHNEDPHRPETSPVLVIGGSDSLTGQQDRPALQVPFSGLTPALLAQLRPAEVICAVMAADHDALQVAARLAELGWHGRLTVRAAGLPNHRMIEAELRAHAPGLRISVVDAPA